MGYLLVKLGWGNATTKSCHVLLSSKELPILSEKSYTYFGREGDVRGMQKMVIVQVGNVEAIFARRSKPVTCSVLCILAEMVRGVSLCVRRR